MAASLNTPPATLSFQNLMTPRPRFDGQDPVYGCSLIFDEKEQKSKQYKALKDACAAAARKKWGDNVNLKNVEMPFRDAGTKAYDGYHAGDTFISPWSKNKPGIVDANRDDVHLPEEVWSGLLVRANVTPFAWDAKGKKGVSFGLNHVQIITAEGRQRLDGRPTAKSAFDDGEVAEANAEPF